MSMKSGNEEDSLWNLVEEMCTEMGVEGKEKCIYPIESC